MRVEKKYLIEEVAGHLKKSDYRDKIAEALFRGLSRYAGSLSHFQMALN